MLKGCMISWGAIIPPLSSKTSSLAEYLAKSVAKDLTEGREARSRNMQVADFGLVKVVRAASHFLRLRHAMTTCMPWLVSSCVEL